MADFENLDAIEDEDALESLVRNDPIRLRVASKISRNSLLQYRHICIRHIR